MLSKSVFSTKSDIWTLGCTFFELAATRRAFQDDWDVMKSYKEPAFHLPLPDFSPTPFIAFVSDMLQPDPHDRPTASACFSMFQSFYWYLEKFGTYPRAMTVPHLEYWRKMASIHSTKNALLSDLEEWRTAKGFHDQALPISAGPPPALEALPWRRPPKRLSSLSVSQSLPRTASLSVQDSVLHDWNVTVPSLLIVDNALMKFVRSDWKSLVKLFDLRYNNQSKIIDHWSTQGQSSATYQSDVGAGRYGDVYQVPSEFVHNDPTNQTRCIMKFRNRFLPHKRV
jgi:serine/threonine protein kinase